MELSEAKRPRQLEEENRQLKHIVAEQAVDMIRSWAFMSAFLHVAVPDSFHGRHQRHHINRKKP